MSHGRKQVRDAIKDILSAGTGWKAVLATRVVPNRQIWDYLLVYCDGEPQTVATVHNPTVYDRNLSVIIAAMIKIDVNKEEFEDRIDSVSAEIETLLTNTSLRAELPGKNLIISLTGSSFTVVVDDEDNIDHAEVVMTWNVNYMTSEGAPETLL